MMTVMWAPLRSTCRSSFWLHPARRSVRSAAVTAAEESQFDVVSAVEASSLPRRWILFTDLHVQKDTLPICVRVLRRVVAEARQRSAGVICLGDFWHAGGVLHTRQLNRILEEIRQWGDDTPLLMIPGNHDQAMRGNPDPLLHALTPLGLANPSVRVFSRPTVLADSLWVPYGTTATELRAACKRAQAKAPLAAVFCHADIVGGLMNEGVSATQGLPPEAFPPLPTRVYSGHYHKPHVVAEPTARGRHIRYAGSPYQTSMAEAGQRKALLVLDRASGWGVEEEIYLDEGPRHHVIAAPSTGQLAEMASSLRPGDRVLVLRSDPEQAVLGDFAAEQRQRGVAVELRTAVDDTLSSAAAAAAAQLGAAGLAAGQSDMLQPMGLFSAYAEAKQLSAPLRALGEELIGAQLAAAGDAAAHPPMHLSLESVMLEGFGCFASRVDYPLGGRGLLLLRGAHIDAARGAYRLPDDLEPAGRVAAAEVGAAAGVGGAGRETGEGPQPGEGEGDDGEVTASNGAGKTTLAMAPLWALTGSTDVRADGKPMEARGVINDGSKRAVVTLRGSVQMPTLSNRSDSGGSNEVAGGGGRGGADADAPTRVPFEVTRTMGKREHTLRFRLGGTVHEGTLAQVQDQLESTLRSSVLGRTAFFGQHAGGGLLDKTDAALKADLQALLPLEVWESVREAARLQAAAARGESDRAAGEMAAAVRLSAQAVDQLIAVEAQAAAWERERQERAATRLAELDALSNSTGANATAGGGSTQGGTQGGVDGAGAGGGEGAGEVGGALEEARSADEAARVELAAASEEGAARLSAEESRVRLAFAAVQAATEAVMEADREAASAQTRLSSAQQRADALRSIVNSWSWSGSRLKAARTMADAGEAKRQRVLRSIVSQAEARGVIGLAELGDLAGSKAGEAADMLGGDLATTMGLEAAVPPVQISELGADAANADALVRALERAAHSKRTEAMAAQQRLQELPAPPLDGYAHTDRGENGFGGETGGGDGSGGGSGDDGSGGGSGGGGSGEDVMTCSSCGQRISPAHLRRQHEALQRAVEEATRAATAVEATASQAKAVMDGARLASAMEDMRDLQAETREAKAALLAVERESATRREALGHTRDEAQRLEQLRARVEGDIKRQLVALTETARQAAARVAAAMELAAAAERRRMEDDRRGALTALKVKHARAALEGVRSEENPHALRRRDIEARRTEIAERRAALEAAARRAAELQAQLSELQEHFGKRGVQNMLYTLALSQIEATAARFAAELSGGRLQLRLAFDDQLRSIRKRVRVRRADGSLAERSISQLSGGEWRRLGLALSLAFADFSQQRLGVSCNVLVLDEVMQHMDVDGQAAMARVLAELRVETTIVIAHGLASDALYGDFEAVDVVERVGDTSRVRIGSPSMMA